MAAGLYASGAWEIDLGRREMRNAGVAVPLGGRAFDIIEVFVVAAGDLVSKDDVIARVWPGAIVEENTLQVHISAIRKALGPDRGMLKTSSGRGYRLAGGWIARHEHRPNSPTAPEPASTSNVPTTINLPIASTDLVGRATAARSLRDLVSAYRVVTLTGPGGIGKTALALETARSVVANFDGEVRLVELVSLSNASLLPSAVASILGLRMGSGEISAEAVAQAIGEKRLLLIFDNCEHVVDAAARLAETLVRLCPRTSILATSQEILRVQGEYVYRVLPLEVPLPELDEEATVLAHSAIQLLIARTKALDSSFSPRPDDFPVMSGICRRLDGIPLAIELAAARVATLGVRQVAARLNDRFNLLTAGRRTALARHQTLRATLDWSYELLPEGERRLVRHLGVFPGGFTMDAAIAIMSDSGALSSRIGDELSNLVSKSLVTLDRSAPSDRWRLLETTRAYALERLAEHGELDNAVRRHAEFFRGRFASTTADRQPSSPVASGGFTHDIDNVRAALDWSFSPVGDATIGVDLTAAYVPVWTGLGLWMECRERIERALERLDPGSSHNAPVRMRLNIALGFALVITMGDIERTRIVLADAREIGEAIHDLEATKQALLILYTLQFNIGDMRAARLTVERFSDIAHRTNDPAAIISADLMMGTLVHHAGEQRDAQRLYEQLLNGYLVERDRQDLIGLDFDQRPMARALLARTLWLQGFVDQADEIVRAIVQEALTENNRLSLWFALRFAACPLFLLSGDVAAAAPAVAMLTELATKQNAQFWKMVARCLEGRLLIQRGELATGTALLRSALETCERSGWAIWYPDFLGTLAEGLSALGEASQAVDAIDQALARANRDGELWNLAELLRIKGELLVKRGDAVAVVAAEACFDEALALARKQNALFWELRVALSLASLRMTQDRNDDARKMLAPVLGRFSSSCDTTDLRAAKELLASFPAQT